MLGGETLKVELRNGTIHLEGYVNAVGRESRELRDTWKDRKSVV